MLKGIETGVTGTRVKCRGEREKNLKQEERPLENQVALELPCDDFQKLVHSNKVVRKT